MKFTKQLICLSLCFGGIAKAQEHVHGAGTVFVIQDGANWQMQYVLSAADALGFEHAPEDKKQRDSLANLGHTLEKIENLVQLDGKCKQLDYSHNLDVFEGQESVEHKHGDHHEEEKEHHHDEHDEHDEHHEDHDGHDEEHEVHHQNIEVSYTLQCTNQIKGLSFAIFDKMHSLQTLEVQWSIASGQGSATLTNSVTNMEFN